VIVGDLRLSRRRFRGAYPLLLEVTDGVNTATVTVLLDLTVASQWVVDPVVIPESSIALGDWYYQIAAAQSGKSSTTIADVGMFGSVRGSDGWRTGSMRQAMGEAYIGDTIMAKQLLPLPPRSTSVSSVCSLAWPGRRDPTAQAISGDNIKAVMAALDLTDNAKRVALVQQLIARFVPSHTIYPHAGCSVFSRQLEQVSRTVP
jgi:hypothetical protein